MRKVSARRVFRYLRIDTGARRWPSACSEMFFFKKGMLRDTHMGGTWIRSVAGRLRSSPSLTTYDSSSAAAAACDSKFAAGAYLQATGFILDDFSAPADGERRGG